MNGSERNVGPGELQTDRIDQHRGVNVLRTMPKNPARDNGAKAMPDERRSLHPDFPHRFRNGRRSSVTPAHVR